MTSEPDPIPENGKSEVPSAEESIAPDPSEVYHTRMQALIETGRPAQVEEVFAELCRTPGLKPNEHHYNIRMQALIKAGKPAQVEKAFARLCRTPGLKPNEHHYNIRMHALIEARKPAQVEEVFAELCQTPGLQPNEQVYTTRMNALIKAGRPAQVEEVFAEFCQKSGTEPTAYILTVMMNAYVKVGKLKKAEGVLERMIQAGVLSSEITCTSLMNVYIKMRQPQKAEAVLERVIQAGVLPNEVTFTRLMKAYAQAGQLEKVEAVLKRMIQAGVLPDEVAFRKLTDAYAQAGQLEQAEAVLECMIQAGVSPEESIFNKLMNAYAQTGQPEKAERVLECMIQARVSPNQFIFNILMNAYAQAGQPEQAEAVLERMIQAGVLPNEVTFSTLVKAYAKAGQLEQAEGVLERVIQAGVLPNEIAFSRLMKGYAQAGQLEKVDAVLKHMIQAGVLPDGIAFRKLIKAYAQAGQPEKAEGVLERMIQAGVLLNEVPFKTLMKAYIRAGQLGKVDGVLERMTQAGLPPDDFTFNTLIRASALRGDLDASQRWFTEMTNAGHQPNIHTYTALIAGSLRCTQPGRALSYLREMLDSGIQPSPAAAAALVDQIGRVLPAGDSWKAFNGLRGFLGLPEQQKGVWAIILQRKIRAGQWQEVLDLSVKVAEPAFLKALACVLFEAGLATVRALETVCELLRSTGISQECREAAAGVARSILLDAYYGGNGEGSDWISLATSVVEAIQQVASSEQRKRTLCELVCRNAAAVRRSLLGHYLTSVRAVLDPLRTSSPDDLQTALKQPGLAMHLASFLRRNTESLLFPQEHGSQDQVSLAVRAGETRKILLELLEDQGQQAPDDIEVCCPGEVMISAAEWQIWRQVLESRATDGTLFSFAQLVHSGVTWCIVITGESGDAGVRLSLRACFASEACGANLQLRVLELVPGWKAQFSGLPARWQMLPEEVVEHGGELYCTLAWHITAPRPLEVGLAQVLEAFWPHLQEYRTAYLKDASGGGAAFTGTARQFCDWAEVYWTTPAREWAELLRVVFDREHALLVGWLLHQEGFRLGSEVHQLKKLVERWELAAADDGALDRDQVQKLWREIFFLEPRLRQRLKTWFHDQEQSWTDVVSVLEALRPQVEGRRGLRLLVQGEQMAYVRLDSEHLRMVCLNLLVNAADAVTQLPEPRPTIEVEINSPEDTEDTGSEARTTTIIIRNAYDPKAPRAASSTGLGLDDVKWLVRELAGGEVKVGEDAERPGWWWKAQITLPAMSPL